MILSGAINGFAIGEVEINGDVGEPVAIEGTAVASITLAADAPLEVLTALVPDVEPLSLSLADTSMTSEDAVKDGIIPELIADLTFVGHIDPTVNPSRVGTATIAIENPEGFTVNPSSDGVSDLRVVSIEDFTVSGGKDAGGVAVVALAPTLEAAVWTYLFPGGLASIAVVTLTAAKGRPNLPSDYRRPPPHLIGAVPNRARDRLHVAARPRDDLRAPSRQTLRAPDGRDAMRVPAGDRRLHVDEQAE